MDTKSSISPKEWHIPRPSLSGSNASSSSDARSRGGSASSQGSSSNHSTHSACSGSLLLSAAHLARMHGSSPNPDVHHYRNHLGNYGMNSGHFDTVVTIPEETKEQTDSPWSDVKRGSAVDTDAQSVASSTHFTVVNGFTKHRVMKNKSWCCDHSHQITVLVISMTILFSACILAAICFVEMRIRRETGIYKYS